jgi:hypothetical protein
VELVRRNESQVVKGLDEGTVVALANPDQATRKQQGGSACRRFRQMMGDLLLPRITAAQKRERCSRRWESCSV